MPCIQILWCKYFQKVQTILYLMLFLSDFFVTFSRIFSTLKLQNIDSKRVKHCKNCKIRSIYMISNSQTLKIKISIVRYPNFVMKIFSESSNDSLFDDVFIRFFDCLFTNIFVVEVYKFTFIDLIESKLWIWRFSLILPSKL